jgi:acetyl-CoA acetyltransferase
MTSIRDKTAIVGIGTTDFGADYRRRDPTVSAFDLALDALTTALDDSGLTGAGIDGLICCRVPSYGRMATMIGARRLNVVNVYEGTGRMSGLALQTAVRAIVTGAAEVVACVYGNNGRTAGATYGGATGEPSGRDDTVIYDAMYGMTSPGAYISLMWRRYQHLYGVPDGALAPVAISNRRNGALNPNAVMREPITTEQYLAAPFIAEPLRLLDYCLINDGGVAFIVTSAERAKDLRKRPVYVSASAASSDLTNFYTSDDLFYGAGQQLAGKVYRDAGIDRSDVDCAQIYDNFTAIVVLSLESLGFCEPGTGWQWIRDGRIELGGELPVNTSGGHTAEGYMQGWGLHVEAVRQLRGEAGERQVPSCEIVQYACLAPISTSHILRN